MDSERMCDNINGIERDTKIEREWRRAGHSCHQSMKYIIYRSAVAYKYIIPTLVYRGGVHPEKLSTIFYYRPT